MLIDCVSWKPQKMFDFLEDDDDANNDDTQVKKDGESGELLDNLSVSDGASPMALSGREQNEAFTSNFQSSVSGLSTHIESIV